MEGRFAAEGEELTTRYHGQLALASATADALPGPAQSVGDGRFRPRKSRRRGWPELADELDRAQEGVEGGPSSAASKAWAIAAWLLPGVAASPMTMTSWPGCAIAAISAPVPRRAR